MEKSIPRNNADKYCQDLKPQDKAVYVRDSEVKGLVLRVKPTGTKSWIFCYTVPCHKKKWRERKKGLGCFKYGRNDVAGLTVATARREAERLKNEVKHNGADPVEDKRKRADDKELKQPKKNGLGQLLTNGLAKSSNTKRNGKVQCCGLPYQ